MNKPLIKQIALMLAVLAASFAAALAQTAAITSSESEVVPQDANRRWIIIANPAGNPAMVLKLDQSSAALTMSNGIPLAAGEKLAIFDTERVQIAGYRITALHGNGTNVHYLHIQFGRGR
ncbi:MAG: hypothetical protein IAE97_00190 [Chthoniobacterales bacterium]|nr:hypothetical protein [Chthoniobacterales bacterium]